MSSDAQGFGRRGSVTQQRRLSRQFKRHAWLGPPSEVRGTETTGFAGTNVLKTVYAGVSSFFTDTNTTTVAIAIRDTTYLLDFLETKLETDPATCTQKATDFIVNRLKEYMDKHLEKILGLAMPTRVANDCTQLCSRLWAELDIIPLVIPECRVTDSFTSRERSEQRTWDSRTIDEQAESMARKCVR